MPYRNWGVAALVAALALFASPAAFADTDGDGYEIAVQSGSRGASSFKGVSDSEIEGIVNELGNSGARGAKGGKINLDKKINIGGKSGARGGGFSMSLREMKDRYNKIGQRLKKQGVNLRKPGKNGVVQALKSHRKLLEAAAKRAESHFAPKVKTSKPWRFWQRFGKKKGARGAGGATPFVVDSKYVTPRAKSGARGAGKAAKFEKKASKYPVDFDNKIAAGKIGGSYHLVATARKVTFKAAAVANGRLFKKSFSILDTGLSVTADSDAEKVTIQSHAKILGKTKKLPSWLNKSFPSKFTYNKEAWSKSFNEEKPYKFDIVVCKGNGKVWGSGKVGVDVGLDVDTLNVSGRVRPFAMLKGGIKGTGKCVGNDYGFEGQITLIDAWVEFGANAGLYEDKQGLYVEAGLYGKYQYTALKGKLSAWWRGWASDIKTGLAKGACKAFGWLAKKKCKKVEQKKYKTNRKTFFDSAGYTGAKNFLSLSKKAYLKGSNPKAASNGRGAGGKVSSPEGKRPTVVVKPRVRRPNVVRRPGGKPRVIVRPKGKKPKIVVRPKTKRPNAINRAISKAKKRAACKKSCKANCNKQRGKKKRKCKRACNKSCR